MSNRELWIAGNLFKHVDNCALGLYALGDLIKACDADRLEGATLNGLGHIIYEIGSSLSQTTESAVKSCNFPENCS